MSDLTDEERARVEQLKKRPMPSAAEFESVRALIESRGKVPAEMLSRMLPYMEQRSYNALCRAEEMAERTGDADWREELKMLRFVWEIGFKAYLNDVGHEIDSDPRTGIITPANYLAGWDASPTGSAGEIARKIGAATGKHVTRQAVRQWAQKNPHLAKPKK